jgi:hypothetical protein
MNICLTMSKSRIIGHYNLFGSCRTGRNAFHGVVDFDLGQASGAHGCNAGSRDALHCQL